MLGQKTAERPVKGKTYSLFGNTTTTTQYYTLIEKLADLCLQQCPDTYQLLAHLQKISGKKRFLKNQLGKQNNHSLTSFIINSSRGLLSMYTTGVEAHLRDSSIVKLRDSILSTTEEQYYLYMLEVELANRAYAESFRQSETKIAFLPHCLHDLDRSCRAAPEPGDIDYTCKGCSKKCFINHISTLLRAHGIKPYIWMDADLETVFKDLRAEGISFGILGIACIPELVSGMRLCMRSNIPVVGIPLSANRCARWMGQFHNTSVNLEELEKLIS